MPVLATIFSVPAVTSTVALNGTVPPVNGAPFTVTVPVGVAVGGGIGADDEVVVVVVVDGGPPPPPPPPGAAVGIVAAVGKRKLPSHEGYERVVTPFAVALTYDFWPGAISVVTRPPFAGVISPTCTAAVQTELSSV